MQLISSKLFAFALAFHDVAGHVIARSATTSSASSTTTHATNTGKRGLPYNNPLLTKYFSLPGQDSLVSWAYNWYYKEPNLSELNSALEYIPLLYNANPSVTKPWATAAQAAIDNGATYLFSYNEPDIVYSGSNYMNISLAVNTWMEYMEPFAGKAKLVAPAVTNAGAPYGLTWLSWFIGNCTECTIDAINIHWYSNQYAGAAYLESHTKDARVVANGLPIIISEFGLDDSSGGYTDTELLEFLEAALPWLDAQDDIVRYAYFYDAAGYLINSAGTGLSDSGVLYNNYTGANVTALCPNLNGTTYIDPTSGSNFIVECNIDRAGGNLDVTMPTVYTLAECIASCASTSGCMDVALYEGTCYMKGSIGKSSTNTAVQGAKLITASSSTSSRTSTTSSSASSTFSTTSSIASTSSSSSHALSSSSSSSSSRLASASTTTPTTSSTSNFNSSATSSTLVSATSSRSTPISSSTSASVTGSVSPTISFTVPSSSSSLVSSSTSHSVSSSSLTSSSLSTSIHVSSTTSSAAASKTSVALCPGLNSTIYTDPATGSNYLIECGIDHYAGNLKMIYVNNLVQCISTCANTTGCVDVSLSGNACYMKSSVGSASKNSGVLGAKLVVSTTSTQASFTSTAISSSSTHASSASASVYSSSMKTPPSSTAAVSSVHSSSTSMTVSTTSTPTSSTSTAVFSSQATSLSLGAKYAISSSSTSFITSLSSTTHAATSSSSTTSAAIATTTALCPHLNSTIYTEPSTGYNFTIECGIDHNAGILKMVHVIGLAACIQTCATTTGCVDVSLSGTACYMKSSIGKSVANSGINGARLVTSASASATTTASTSVSAAASAFASTSASASASTTAKTT